MLGWPRKWGESVGAAIGGWAGGVAADWRNAWVNNQLLERARLKLMDMDPLWGGAAFLVSGVVTGLAMLAALLLCTHQPPPRNQQPSQTG